MNEKDRTKRFDKGDEVRDCYGNRHVVMRADESTVWFYDGSWAHPTKCFKVYWSKAIGRYVAIPENA